MKKVGNFTVMFNPWGPRLVISHRSPERQLIVAVGGWFMGRKVWPRHRYFSVERYP